MWAWTPTSSKAGEPGDPVHGQGGVAAGQAEAELGVDLAGHHVLVGVGLDARRHPHHHPGGAAVVGVERLQPADLVEGVDDDPDAEVVGPGQLGLRLVVAVEDEPVGGDARGQGHVQLAAGGHVDVHALLVDQAGHGQAEEGLRPVGHPVAEGGHRLPAPGPQVVLVVDEQGRAVLLGQVEQVDAAHAQPAVGADHGGVGQDVAGKGGAVHGPATTSRPCPLGGVLARINRRGASASLASHRLSHRCHIDSGR